MTSLLQHGRRRRAGHPCSAFFGSAKRRPRVARRRARSLANFACRAFARKGERFPADVNAGFDKLRPRHRVAHTTIRPYHPTDEDGSQTQLCATQPTPAPPLATPTPQLPSSRPRTGCRLPCCCAPTERSYQRVEMARAAASAPTAASKSVVALSIRSPTGPPCRQARSAPSERSQ